MGPPPRLARILDVPEMIQKRFQARLRQALKKGNAHGRRLQITAATKSPKRDRKPPSTRVRSLGCHYLRLSPPGCECDDPAVLRWRKRWSSSPVEPWFSG